MKLGWSHVSRKGAMHTRQRKHTYSIPPSSMLLSIAIVNQSGDIENGVPPPPPPFSNAPFQRGWGGHMALGAHSKGGMDHIVCSPCKNEQSKLWTRSREWCGGNVSTMNLNLTLKLNSVQLHNMQGARGSTEKQVCVAHSSILSHTHRHPIFEIEIEIEMAFKFVVIETPGLR